MDHDKLRQQAKELLLKKEDELFERIGKALSEDDERSINDLSEKGRIWFEKYKKRLANRICSEYEKLKNKDHVDAAIDIAAIISDSFTGVPTLIIAVIILKTGLKSLCKKEKSLFRVFKPTRRKKHG